MQKRNIVTVREMILLRLRSTPKQRQLPGSQDVPIGANWSPWQRIVWHVGVVAIDSPVVFVLALAGVVFLIVSLF